MTTPDPITTAREALRRLANTEVDYPGYSFESDYETVQAALIQAEKLKAENERLTNKVQSQHDHMAPKYDAAMAEVEKLKAERDEALAELALRRPSDKDVAQTREARRQYRAKLKELYGNADALPMQITRLTSQLEQCKADDRKAMEVIERQKEEVFQANKMARDLEITAALLKIELEQAERVIKPFAREAREWLSTTPNATPVLTMGPSDSDPTVSEFTLGDLRAASQWIKDRQAKGEAS